LSGFAVPIFNAELVAFGDLGKDRMF
jgi:hypothetical protein